MYDKDQNYFSRLFYNKSETLIMIFNQMLCMQCVLMMVVSIFVNQTNESIDSSFIKSKSLIFKIGQFIFFVYITTIAKVYIKYFTY